MSERIKANIACGRLRDRVIPIVPNTQVAFIDELTDAQAEYILARGDEAHYVRWVPWAKRPYALVTVGKLSVEVRIPGGQA